MIFFYYVYKVIVILAAIFCIYTGFSKKTFLRARAKHENAFNLLALLGFLLLLGSTAIKPKELAKNNDSDNVVLLNHKLNKSLVKSKEDGLYYVSKENKDIRYFADDDDIVTAAKVVYSGDIPYRNYFGVISDSTTILNDEDLECGSDKKKLSDVTLDIHKDYSIYSPKYKKWYHISMMPYQGSKKKVSQFSVWPGKNDDGDDEDTDY